MDQVQAQYGKRHPEYDKAASQLAAVRTQLRARARTSHGASKSSTGRP